MRRKWVKGVGGAELRCGLRHMGRKKGSLRIGRIAKCMKSMKWMKRFENDHEWILFRDWMHLLVLGDQIAYITLE